MNTIKTILRRAVTWLRRNPIARAEALDLAAASMLERAASTPEPRASRMRRRASALHQRAADLRAR